MNGTGRLSDRAIVTDCLNTEKFAADNAGRSALESASAFVRRDFENIGRDCSDNVDVLFRLMSGRGWYSPPQATQQSISQAQQQVGPTISSIMPSAQAGVSGMVMGVGQPGAGWGGQTSAYGGGTTGGYGGGTTSRYAGGGTTGGYGGGGTTPGGYGPGTTSGYSTPGYGTGGGVSTREGDTSGSPGGRTTASRTRSSS